MREKITIKFNGNIEDIIMVSDSISIYDTTEGTTIIQVSGYPDKTISKGLIKSISLENIQDKMRDKKTNEILVKLCDVRGELVKLANRLESMEYKCIDLTECIQVLEDEIEVHLK